MAKINKEEYELLKILYLEGRFKWIARDGKGYDGGNLFAYSEKPIKNCDIERWLYSRGGFRSIDNHIFQFIQWEDREPCSIAELIREYEKEELDKRQHPTEFSKEQGSGRMIRLQEHEDFDGVEVSLHKMDGSFLLLLGSEDGNETLSVWITKEQLISFINELGEVNDMEYSTKTIKINPQDLIGSKVEFDNPIHSPSHYMQGHIETIDKIKLLLTPEEFLGYLKGNVIKYDRAPFKGNMEQDYDKQKVYYDWALKQMEEQGWM